jgi:hypothetical protein
MRDVSRFALESRALDSSTYFPTLEAARRLTITTTEGAGNIVITSASTHVIFPLDFKAYDFRGCPKNRSLRRSIKYFYYFFLVPNKRPRAIRDKTKQSDLLAGHVSGL